VPDYEHYAREKSMTKRILHANTMVRSGKKGNV
jgi:hypothetical protein